MQLNTSLHYFVILMRLGKIYDSVLSNIILKTIIFRIMYTGIEAHIYRRAVTPLNQNSRSHHIDTIDELKCVLKRNQSCFFFCNRNNML